MIIMVFESTNLSFGKSSESTISAVLSKTSGPFPAGWRPKLFGANEADKGSPVLNRDRTLKRAALAATSPPIGHEAARADGCADSLLCNARSLKNG